MQVRILLFLFFFLSILQNGFAQKQVIDREQLWMGYFNQTRLTNKWGLWGDFHLRRTDNFVEKWALGIARLGLTYYVNDHVKLTAGYAYVNHFPSTGHKNISQPEHRPWQQIQWHTNSKKIKIMQWLRTEQRFRQKIKSDDELAEGYNFNHRFRYNFALFVALSKKNFDPNSIFLILNNEIHLNFGKEITYNTFDQNRAFVGLGYQLSSHTHLQLGYMNVFQQLSSGNTYYNTHTIRAFLFHNVDLRKKN